LFGHTNSHSARGQAVLAERRLEDLARPVLVGRRQSLAAEEVPAIAVDERERIAELAVSGAEVALVIRSDNGSPFASTGVGRTSSC